MFSLIISIISVLLVVVLAIATIYYGGSSSQTAGAKASAAALVNQAVQIAGAGALTSVNGQAWPGDTGGIVFPTDVLTQMPTPPKTAYASGQTPTANDWTYYQTGAHHFVLKDKINKEVCLAVNRAQGVSGIPATLVPTAMVQCFGISAPYTFYYDPPGTTATQTNDAVKKSVDDANTAISGGPLPVYVADIDPPGTPTTVTTITPNGYPLHWASGLWIASGACRDGVNPGTGPGPGPVSPPVTQAVQDCLDNPSAPGCADVLPSNKALQIRGWSQASQNGMGQASLEFVGAPDCSNLPDDTVCLPQFKSLTGYWTWTGFAFNDERQQFAGFAPIPGTDLTSGGSVAQGMAIVDSQGQSYTLTSTRQTMYDTQAIKFSDRGSLSALDSGAMACTPWFPGSTLANPVNVAAYVSCDTIERVSNDGAHPIIPANTLVGGIYYVMKTYAGGQVVVPGSPSPFLTQNVANCGAQAQVTDIGAGLWAYGPCNGDLLLGWKQAISGKDFPSVVVPGVVAGPAGRPWLVAPLQNRVDTGQN